jgi:cysteine-rich repeat protein
VIDPGNTLLTEICDDGNSSPFDGCTNCAIDPGWTCTPGTPFVCKFCGNGKLEIGE